MSGVFVVVGDAGPHPEEALTPADFVALLRRVRDRSGLSLRLIQRRAAAGGHTLPPSTLATMLNRDTLPNERLIVGFLHACGQNEETVARWVDARRRIASCGPTMPLSLVDDLGKLAVRQLPMDIEEFTGRAAALEALTTIDDSAGTAVSVTAITGMAGVGKTRLAIRAAHLLVRQEMFDEIQLWTDLQGFDLHQPPLDPAVVLETFLRTLGMSAGQIPNGLDSRSTALRDRLAGRRALILLDNAADENQIRPLLPGSPTNHVLVTSRHTLTGLDGARHLELEVFTAEEAMALLVRLVGRQRIDADPEAARRIAELCGRLPLALSIAARRLATRPAWTLAAMENRLKVNTLAQLSSSNRTVAVVFNLSYQALPAAEQRMFRLLGEHLADDIDAHAAAALADMPARQADHVLELLLDEHLLIQATPGRYRMHDLVQLFASDQVTAAESDESLNRLLDHYQAGAEQVTRMLHPTEARRLPAEPAASTWAERVITTPADATRWLQAEHRNLLGIARHADTGPHRALPPLIRLITVLYRPLTNLGLSSTHIQLIKLAITAARRIRDRAAEALLLEDLGTVYGQHGQLSEAIEHNTQALTIWRELGDQTGQAGCLTGLGIAYYQQHRYAEAITTLTAALEPSRESGYALGEASILNFLGLVHQGMAEFDQAISWHEQSMRRYQQAGSEHGWAFALANLGWAHQRSGNPRAAIDCHERTLPVFARVSDRYNEAEQHWGLGQAWYALNDPIRAREHWNQAIALLRDAELITQEEATTLLHQPVPDTPEIIRLNS